MVSSLDNWDGGLSKSVKPQSTGTNSNAGTSKTTTTQDGRINIGTRHGWQDAMPGLGENANDAPNLNQLLSRDSLVRKPTAPSMLSIVTSGITSSPPTLTRKTLSFLPVVSSPLHGKKSGPPSVAPTPIVLSIPNPLTPRGRSPFLVDPDAIEIVSTHTADGEGEDEAEAEEVTVVHDMLAMYSAPTSQACYDQNLSYSNISSHDSPLFTPPPNEDARSVDRLFTPCPSPKQTQTEPSSVHRRLRSRRLFMSHVQVPPLKRPRGDYRRFLSDRSSIVNRRRVPSGPPATLRDVLQASLQHNANIGTFPYDSLKKKPRLTRKRNEDREDNIVAGPSSRHYPTGSTIHAATIKTGVKRSFMDDNDNGGAPPRPKKRSRPTSESIVVDLTITDDDARVGGPKVKPTPKPNLNPTSKLSPSDVTKSKFVHAAYSSEMDIVTLCLEDIRPVPLDVLTLNTRFLRQSLGNDDKEVSAPGPEGNMSNISRIRQNGWRPSSSVVANSSMDTVEEVSVGGVLWELSEEEIEKEVIEISSDSDTGLKENVPQQHTDAMQVPTSSVNVGLTIQHQKKPQGSQQSQQPKRQHQAPSHNVNRNVNRSSSIFLLSPSPAMPPSLKVGLGKQYPKKARESQHSHQQQARKRDQGSSSAFNTPHKQIVASPLPPSQVQVSTPNVKVTPQYQKKHRQHSSGGSGLKPSSTASDPPLTSQVRPPHSARSSLNGRDLDSGPNYPSGAIPSAKALGKRRAISPASISATTSPQQHLHLPPSFFSASIHDIQLASRRSSTPTDDPFQNSDFNTFINYSRDITSAEQSFSVPANGVLVNAPSLSSSYNPLDTLASLYDQSSSSRNQSESRHIGSDIDTSHHHLSSSDTHTPTLSHTLVYNSQPQPGFEPGSRGESFFSSSGSLYNDVGFPGDQDNHRYEHEPQQQYGTTVDDLWSSSLVKNHSERQYAYETIDPTLLGGGEATLLESHLEPDLDMGMDDTVLDVVGMELGVEIGSDDQVQQKDSSQLGPGSEGSSPTSSSTDSSSSFSDSSRVKEKTRPPVLPSAKNEKDREHKYKRTLPPRKRTKRIMPDMISHDDIDLLESPKSKPRPLSSSAGSSPDTDRSISDSESGCESVDVKAISIRKPMLKPKARISTNHSRARSASPIEQKPTIPTAVPTKELTYADVESFCHQCRRKTFYSKMTCSSCQKKFCVRCYAFRYPECEFDVNDEEYSCPACEGYCNCTVCCRKRGEQYIGVRTCDPVPSAPPLRLQRLRGTNVERAKLSDRTDLPPPKKTVKTTVIPKGATQAWGSLYSVTGEKIGACFFDPSTEKDSSIVFAHATTSIITAVTGVTQQVETAAPKSQGKKKKRIFIGAVQPCWGYTNPKIRPLKAEPYAKRSYNAMPRYYVGKKKYLFYPIDKDDSSLTSVEEDDEVKEPEGTGLVEGKTFAPDSLGEGDIARAILLGLSACGVAAVQVPT